MHHGVALIAERQKSTCTNRPLSRLLSFCHCQRFWSMVAYSFVVLHQEKVVGIVTLGMAFMPPVAYKHHFALPEGFYVTRWQEHGRAENDFVRFDVKTVVRNIYIFFSRSEMPIADEDQEIMDLVEPSTPLPSWFTEKDLATYAALYEKSGFQIALQVPYRSSRLNLGSIEQVPIVKAPTMVIIGKEDYALKVPGVDEYIRSGEVKKYVPNLETIYVPNGYHFVHEQFPGHVNQLILTFLDHTKYA
ncbi:putative alpha/Beta hydrolase [Helianthus anomalus]